MLWFTCDWISKYLYLWFNLLSSDSSKCACGGPRSIGSAKYIRLNGIPWREGWLKGYVRGLPAGDWTGLTCRKWSSRVGTLHVGRPSKGFEPGLHITCADTRKGIRTWCIQLCGWRLGLEPDFALCTEVQTRAVQPSHCIVAIIYGVLLCIDCTLIWLILYNCLTSALFQLLSLSIFIT